MVLNAKKGRRLAMFSQNESQTDRIVRAVLGAVLLAAAWFTGGILGIILGVVGVVLIFTAITGSCLIYRLFNFSTKK
jgi:hypothetical protein